MSSDRKQARAHARIPIAAFALYAIRAKDFLQQTPALTPRGLYALITISACITLMPIAIATEALGVGATAAVAASGGTIYTGWRLAGMMLFTGAPSALSPPIHT